MEMEEEKKVFAEKHATIGKDDEEDWEETEIHKIGAVRSANEAKPMTIK